MMVQALEKRLSLAFAELSLRRGGVGLVFLPLFFAPASSQVVHGTVLDDASGLPIHTAEVELLAADDSVVGRYVTNESGRFVAPVPDAGLHRLRARRIGYLIAVTDEFGLPPGQDGLAELRLEPSPVMLDPLEPIVEGQSLALAGVGFYRRETMGFSQVRTPDYIEAKPPLDLPALLVGLPGIVVSRPGGSTLFDVFSTRRPMVMQCRPSVSIDGLVMQMGGRPSSGWQETLVAQEVAAIEVIAGAGGLPAWVAGSVSPCGAILIWTKGYVGR